MKYINYTPEDFFKDENFRNWIVNDDSALNYFWEKWIMEHPHKKEEIEIAKKLVLGLQFKDELLSDRKKKLLWQKIDSMNRQYDKTTLKTNTEIFPIYPLQQSGPSKRSFSFYFYRIAAGLLILVIAGLWLTRSPFEEQSDYKGILVEKANPSGQKSKIFLSDGSVVYLNANSEISYLENFQDNKRIVNLLGEAFFEVEKDSLKPFIVVTGSLKTTALGTKFNVSAYPDEDNITVSLLEGKVEVYDEDHKKLILNDAEAINYDKKNSQLNRSEFIHSKAVLWKDGTLYFDKTPFKEVIDELERWYGVDISVSGTSKEAQVISGQFDNESLSNVMQSISHSIGFSYRMNGEMVKIEF
ncbi:MAG: FecR domain-containing protein [Cytophagales bacterium]|nr:FecR domain-containing protein [Cytophagales bacterium]